MEAANFIAGLIKIGFAALILLMLLGLSAGSEEPSNDYCEGFERGYCLGWRSVKGRLSSCPAVPSCPTPEAGADEYDDGVIEGYRQGREDAEDS